MTKATGAVSGALVEAPGSFGAEWAERCGSMVTAIAGAGTNAGSNADRHGGDDDAVGGITMVDQP